MPTPQFESQPVKESQAEKSIPQPEKETSIEEFNDMAGKISHKAEVEAQETIAKNQNTGFKAIESLGGGDLQKQELKKRDAAIAARIVSLGGKYAQKIKDTAELKKPEDLPDKSQVTKKDLKKSEGLLKKVVKTELKIAKNMFPFSAMKPAIRMWTEKEYRDYVIEKAPQVAPVLAKAIATEGASLKNPNDIRILIDFAVNDPKSPEFIKKWANKALNSKEGQAALAKAGKKIEKGVQKKQQQTKPPIAA